ncbi:phage virion morphogenesis protein [Rhizobium sp. SL86]|nr:phage virion morphogenesis protein [Rhizobium sp. SL86]
MPRRWSSSSAAISSKAKSVTLPARPYLGISAEDETSVAEIVFSSSSAISPLIRHEPHMPPAVAG